MNNRHICKAKRKDNNEWVEGYYVCLNGDFIYTGYAETDCGEYYPDCHEVIPETVVRCTGLEDKNGKLIFEGDILHAKTGKGWSCPIGTDIYYKVVYTRFNIQRYANTEYICFMAERNNNHLSPIHYIVATEGAEVIGNEFDNPDLLEVER